MTDKHQQELQQKGLKFACTDVGNSERFIADHGDKVRYIPEEKRWVAWDGTRYGDAKISKRAMDTVKSIYDEARDCEGSGKTELTNWAKRSNFKTPIEAMKQLAQDELSVSITLFDSNPTTINCLNGIVDLNTGELIKHDPIHLNMKRANVRYVDGAKADAWNAYLGQIFKGDADLIRYVQRVLGYAITGLTKEQKIFIAYGLGANGKTTLFETLLSILGDYGSTTEFSAFLSNKTSDVRSLEAAGKLRGRRLVTASETGSTTKWDEPAVKKASGEDTLTGTKLRGDSYDFKASHKLFFQCNHLPGAKDASHGFWRRIVIVPFKAKFDGKDIDRDLRRKLLAEKEGIFAWLVEGAKAYLSDGLDKLPAVCTEAIDHYRDDNDVLGLWIKGHIVEKERQTVGVKEAYAAYSDWCYRAKEDPTPIKFFSKAMAERGIESKRTAAGNVFVNCQLGDGSVKDPHPANDNDPYEPFEDLEPPKWSEESENRLRALFS